MAIQVLAPTGNRMGEQLALMQMLSQAGQQGVQNYKGYQEQQQQTSVEGKLAEIIGGKKGVFSPAQLDPTQIDVGSGAGTLGTAPTRGRVPGVSNEEALAMVMGGHAGPMLEQAFPKPMSPYQQANLDISREGMGLQRESMGMQREQFASTHELRRDQFASEQEYQQAKLALDRQQLAQDGQPAAPKASDLAAFRGGYEDQSKGFQGTKDAYSKLRSAAANPSPAGDLAMIHGYMKMLDPTSIVRESEAASVAASGSFGEQMQAWGQSLLTGQRLTDSQRSDILAQSGNIFQSTLTQQEQTQRTYGDIAKGTGMDPSLVVPDFIGDARTWAQQQQALPSADVPAAAGVQNLLDRGLGMGQQAVQGAMNAFSGGAPAAPAPPAAGGDFGEGEIVKNPQTGERLILKGGAWVPYNG